MNYILFLSLLVPLLCEGDRLVKLTMPSVMALGSDVMEVTCEYSGFDKLARLTLIYGQGSTRATYLDVPKKFFVTGGADQKLETAAGTTFQVGSLKFVFSKIGCDRFGNYSLEGLDAGGEKVYAKSMLEVLPKVYPIIKTSKPDPAVDEMATFECQGTIGKDSDFSVKWYLGVISDSNQLDKAKTVETADGDCLKNVSSSLTYYVRKLDVPTLNICCRMESAQILDQQWNTTIQAPPAAGCGMKDGSILVLMVAVIACTYHLI